MYRLAGLINECLDSLVEITVIATFDYTYMDIAIGQGQVAIE